MWSALKRLFRKPKPQGAGPSPLDLAREARKGAAEAYAFAHSRGDTRAEHWALKRYRKATHALMRLEREVQA